MARPRGRGTDDVARLRDELKGGQVRPFYLLHGDDAHRKEGIVATICRIVLGEQGEGLGLQRFDGQQHDLAAVLQQALSLPMFVSRQVIVVRHAQDLVGDAAGQERLVAYAGAPAPGTTLVLDADQIDGRRTWVKQLKQMGVVYAVDSPQERELGDWVARFSRQAKVTLTGEQVDRLIELVGDDLQQLKHEIDKLALLQDEDADLKQASLDVLLARRSVDVFELIRSLEPGRTPASLLLLHRFLAEGRDVNELAPLLAWRIRQVFAVGILLEEGLSQQQIASTLGITAYAVRQTVEVARRWGDRRRASALNACVDLERDIKLSRMPPTQAIERFIVSITA